MLSSCGSQLSPPPDLGRVHKAVRGAQGQLASPPWLEVRVVTCTAQLSSAQKGMASSRGRDWWLKARKEPALQPASGGTMGS